MSQNETEIEAMIQKAGKTAPRLTPDHIDRQIVHCFYINGEEAAFFCGADIPGHGEADRELPQSAKSLKGFTICVLVLKNGFIVTGESAAASPENYDEAIGRKIAFDNARAKIWPLEGYMLRWALELDPRQSAEHFGL